MLMRRVAFLDSSVATKTTAAEVRVCVPTYKIYACIRELPVTYITFITYITYA